MKKILVILICAFLLVALLAACGDVTTGESEKLDPQETTPKSEDTTVKDPITVDKPTVDLYPAFQNPDKSLASKPLWFWNTTLDEMTVEGVKEIVRKSYEESGYMGFGILPYWQEGYLSDQYFELYEAALEEGAKYGMQFSLYDENGFPSYTAGGLFAEKYPHLTAKRLDMSEATAVRDGKIFLKIPQGNFMGAIAWNTKTGEMIDISDKAVLKTLPEFEADLQPVGIMATSTYSITPGYEVDKAFDGNKATRWNALEHAVSGQAIIVNYGKKVKVDEVRLYEDTNSQLHRIKAVDIQYWDSAKNEWVTVASEKGGVTHKGMTLKFDAIEEQYLRIYFRTVTGDSPTVSEINILCNGKEVERPGFVPNGATDNLGEIGFFSSGDYSSGYTAAMAFDGNKATRWNSPDGTSGNNWLSVMYGKEVTVDSVKIYEHLNRIRGFRIEYYDGSSWKTCYTGTTVGETASGKTFSFEPVKAQGIRIYITSNVEGSATIWEMEVYNGEEKVTCEEDLSTYKGSYVEYPVSGNDWKLMAFVCVSEGCIGMDYLSEEAVAGFIEITYEEYYKRFKKYFDNGTITSAFYDEPSFWPAGGLTAYGVQGARMWTDDFNEVFAEMYGDKINPLFYYAAMWYDIGDKTAEARDALNKVRTEMFAKHYIGQVNDWCEKHGISLMGHMLLEDVDNPVPLHGDLMYAFKYQEIPTVDVIDHYGMTEDYYKIIASAAYNWDRELVGCEVFGAMELYRPFTKDILYKTTMDLYAKGINLMVPHAVWYDSTKNVVYPPELSYRNPAIGPLLADYNEYVARIGSLLMKGRHVSDVAVLYPIDTLEYDYNFNKGYGGTPDSNYIALTQMLSEKLRIDYTFLHPSVLDEKVKVNGNILHLDNENNYEDYRVMVLPSLHVISLSNLEKIYDYYKKGGTVISVGTLPSLGITEEENARVVSIITEMFGASPTVASGKAIEKTSEAGGKLYHITSTAGFPAILQSAVENYDVEIEKGYDLNGHLTYIHKVVEEQNVYYFANSSDRKTETSVTLRGEFASLEIWDPATGEKTPLAVTVKDGTTTFKLTLEKVTSLFVVENVEEK